MIIGLDIDDVLSNTHEVLIKYAQIYSEKYLNKNIEKYDSNSFIEVLGCTPEEEQNYYRMYYTKVLNELIPKSYVKEILTKMREDGHKIILITVRSDKECNGNAYEITKDWLNKYEIPYDELITESFNKKEICAKYKVDVFIDDSIKNCELVSELGIPVFLMNASFNILYKDTNKIRRADNVIDFYNKLSELKDK